jgi:hypothetical protein
MLRGLLALFLLSAAVVVSFLVITIGGWAAGYITGWISLAATCLWCLLGFAFVVAIWAAAYAVSPGPTKYLSVFGLIGVVLLSLLSMWILRERELARRNNVMNNLRRIGLELHQMKDIRPEEEPQFDPERLAPPWPNRP